MKQYHIAEPGESPHGPYDESMVRRAFEHGMYPEGTLAWHEGASDWMPINHFFDVQQHPRSLTPPPLPETHTSRQTKAPSPAMEEYYIFEPDRFPDGPYSEKEIQDAYAQHKFHLNASIWGENTTGWIRLNSFILDKYGSLTKFPNQVQGSPAPHPIHNKELHRSTEPKAKQQLEPVFLPNNPPNAAPLPIAARWKLHNLMKKYHVCPKGNTPQGPFPESMVRDAFILGIYDDDTMVCEENTSQWIFIKSAFPPDSLNHPPIANKKYPLWERTLRGIGFLISLLLIVSILISHEWNELAIFLLFTGMGVWEAWDNSMKYGIPWKITCKSSITFWTVAFLIFTIIYFTIIYSGFSPKQLPKGCLMILILMGVRICDQRHDMHKKKYSSPNKALLIQHHFRLR